MGLLMLLLTKREKTMESISKIYYAKATFIFMVVIIFLSIAVLFLALKENKLSETCDYILNGYYNKEHVEIALKDVLGDNYTGLIEEDLENYMITLALDNISKYDDPKWAGYTAFLSKKDLSVIADRENSIKGIKELKAISSEIFYMRFDYFADKETYSLFKDSTDINKYSNLIIDLRYNGGGHYFSAMSISDLFLDKNLVISKEVLSGNKVVHKSKNDKVFSFNSIVFLVSKHTASASEVLINALRDNLDNVVVIGDRTYGKGVSTRTHVFSDKTAIVFISSMLKTPGDYTIHDIGIEPDIFIPGGALERAVEYINYKDKISE